MIISGRRVGMPKVSLEARGARETVLDEVPWRRERRVVVVVAEEVAVMILPVMLGMIY